MSLACLWPQSHTKLMRLNKLPLCPQLPRPVCYNISNERRWGYSLTCPHEIGSQRRPASSPPLFGPPIRFIRRFFQGTTKPSSSMLGHWTKSEVFLCERSGDRRGLSLFFLLAARHPPA